MVEKLNRVTVLHVEDDPNDVLLFEHACRKAGVDFDLKSVVDGDEAMAYLKGTKEFADREEHPLPILVVLDLKMSRLNGFDLLNWIRKDPIFRRLPVVVLTSSNHDVDINRAYSLGANSYLVKPVGFDALVKLAKGIGD